MSPQQMLSDMDRALEIEIKAKEKGGNSKSHIAVDGEPHGEQNGFFLYQYSLNEPWTPDDDTPVNIKELSNRSIKPIIVASTGTTITIATNEPLPPEALKQITLIDDSIELTRRLREALQNIKESDANLDLKVFGGQSHCSLVASSIPSTVFEPNASQKRAINMALGSEVTYIIGPPGTGKTVTLAAIALEHLISERTVLIASHTNIAVDNAIKQLADLCRKAGMDNKLREGRVLRYGATQLPDLKKPEYENISISAVAKRQSAYLSQQKEQLKKALRLFEGDLQKLKADNQKGQDDRENQRQQVIAHATAYKSRLDKLQIIENKRITALINEKTALEDSYRQTMQRLSTIKQQQTTADAEVVRLENAYQQLETHKDNCIAQLTTAQQMSKITRILKGIRLNTLEKEVSDSSYQMWLIGERRKELREQLNQVYAQRANCESELEQKVHRLRQIESQLNRPSEDAERIASLQASISQMKQYLVEGERQWEAKHQYFQQREHELIKSRTGISSQLEELARELQELEKRILAETQVVATTLSKLYMSAALKDRCFDVVIIDEISAAPMPAVYVAASRANQSVITIGDPQQLGPICTAKSDNRLSENEKKLAVSWLGIDLFSKFVINLEAALDGQKACVMLDHQSRMHPHISAIARKYVYKGLLYD